MKVVRTFHPVGQGVFYSERFYEGTLQNVTHNIVFDCGVSIRHEWQVNHVVTQAFTDEDEIVDAVFSCGYNGGLLGMHRSKRKL